ncbi:MAG: hypothetical protein PHI68_05930 [Candidatus Cloacimonetes bacterium]|nr:hypothetical protein [Candidatus Cloacimonadota bacterium]
MQDKWFSIKQIISAVIFIGILSITGLVSGKVWMMPIFALFFAIIAGLIIFVGKGKQRHFEVVKTSNKTAHMIFGAILSLAALVIPLIIVWRTSLIPVPGHLSVGLMGLTFLFTIVFLAFLFVAVYFLENPKAQMLHKVIAYVLIVVASAIPGIVVSSYNRTTNGIGSSYYVALIIVFLAWNGLHLVFKRD